MPSTKKSGRMRDPKLIVPAIYFQRAPLGPLLRFNRINDRLYVQVRCLP